MKDGHMDRREFWQGVQAMFAEREQNLAPFGEWRKGKSKVKGRLARAGEGKLSAKGSDAFYNFIAGAAFGAGRADDPLLFLLMVRGPEELDIFLEKKN